MAGALRMSCHVMSPLHVPSLDITVFTKSATISISAFALNNLHFPKQLEINPLSLVEIFD